MGSSRKSRKRKRVVVEPDDENTFAVEVILKARVTENARTKHEKEHWDYYVKWAGYDSDANTWEPAVNLFECSRLLDSFWKEVGWDNLDYLEGDEVVPSDEWIAIERRRYWQGLSEEEREQLVKKEDGNRAQTQRRGVDEAASTVPDVSAPSRDPSSDPPKPNKTKKKRAKKPRISKEELNSDSDVPLIKQERSKLSTIPLKRKGTGTPLSSDDEPLGQRTKRKKNVPVLDTSLDSTIGSSKSSPQPESSNFLPPAQEVKVDKGKQKAAEEPRSDSPSSLFSVDSTEEASIPSPKPKPEVRPIPERKQSTTSFPQLTTKSTKSKPSPIVTPKVPANPFLKRPDPLPTTTALTGMGISTKQRLGKLALAPVNPKEAKANASLSTRTASHPSTSSKLSDLKSLKFKKTGNSTSTIIVPDESTVESPMIRPPELTLNALNASTNQDQSTVHMFTDSVQIDSPIGTEAPHDPFPISPQVPQYPNANEADEFLASMTGSLPGFNSPLEPTTETPSVNKDPEPKPPPGLVARKTSSIPKIPKKWKWEGQLFTFRANDTEELVGSVVCTNVTTPKPRGMRIPLTFDVMDRLNFISFHDLSDVLIFLEACKTPDQFATLSAQDSESQSKFQVIVNYMTRHEQVVLVPVWYDKAVVGHLVVFPPTFQDLVQQFEVPTEIVSHAGDNLIISLHGWFANPAIRQQESRLSFSDIVPAKTSLAPPFTKGRSNKEGQPGPSFDFVPSLRRSPILHFALRVLSFPPDLFDWLTTSFRLYAIYHEYERGEDRSEPVELNMLKAILKSCQAQEWKHHESKKEYRLRVVFVHVGSVRNFSRSPLTQKRDALDIRFYSYGTDGKVPRSMWGVREIYPIGGVVTFYPSAFVEDYSGTIRLIRKIHEHPLWMAFISPTCLGYLANFASKDQDPLVSYEQQGQTFPYQCLLKLIAEGEIALITPPSESMSLESLKSWVRNYCRTINPLDAMTIGTAAFNSVCANIPETNRLEAVQKNTDRDMVEIQRHPAILYEYRRFIVVKGDKDRAIGPISVEATTPREFTLQDDYFKCKS